MSPDQLASEELAEWREKTIKKELDMIKEVAIEEAQMSSTGTIRKMTYKGEVEIERQSEVQVHVHVLCIMFKCTCKIHTCNVTHVHVHIQFIFMFYKR